MIQRLNVSDSGKVIIDIIGIHKQKNFMLILIDLHAVVLWIQNGCLFLVT